MSSKYSNRKNINYFIVKVGRPGKRLSGRSFYVHSLYLAFHRAVLVVCKFSLVGFCLFCIFLNYIYIE